MALQRAAADKRALAIARTIHESAESEQTFLFGSRARGDYRADSDVDVLIIKHAQPSEPWLEKLRYEARLEQRKQLPEASGVDVICMTPQEFRRRRALRNNLANHITKQGVSIAPGEWMGYGMEYHNESVDWDDVNGKLKDATDAANDITGIAETGMLERFSDKQFDRIAQNALENGYKAVLGAHGYEYPVSGRSGHDLTILTGLIRENLGISGNVPLPGEEHRYLTEFGGAMLYSHEHRPLDKEKIAQDIPQAVAALRVMAEQAHPGN